MNYCANCEKRIEREIETEYGKEISDLLKSNRKYASQWKGKG